MNHNLTLNQMQLLSYAIFCTQQDGVAEFQKDDFQRKFNIQEYTIQQIKEDVKVLTRLSIKSSNNRNLDLRSMFSKIHYKGGLLTFNWSPDFVEVFELKEKLVTDFLKISHEYIEKAVSYHD